MPQLYRRLPAGSRLVNLGVSGSKLHDALRDQLPVALDAHPDLVTLWLVVNDYLGGVSLASYANDLGAALDTFPQGGKARILVGNLPDLGRHPTGTAPVADWNATIEQITAAHGATLVDLASDYGEIGDLAGLISSDGFHPSARGYTLLADAFGRRLP